VHDDNSNRVNWKNNPVVPIGGFASEFGPLQPILSPRQEPCYGDEVRPTTVCCGKVCAEKVRRWNNGFVLFIYIFHSFQSMKSRPGVQFRFHSIHTNSIPSGGGKGRRDFSLVWLFRNWGMGMMGRAEKGMEDRFPIVGSHASKPPSPDRSHLFYTIYKDGMDSIPQDFKDNKQGGRLKRPGPNTHTARTTLALTSPTH